MKRYLINVHGRVQGVGFRYFTERLALKYHVTGSVQNVNDFVEVIAQGEDNQIEMFVQAVINGASPASSVKKHQIEELNIVPHEEKFKVLG
ncbi:MULTISPECIES: acylphosphatase [unclassified Staphylococcus]|uniref:acylphosphatase n=1 Tax=unclassified Staphylococcus TaxID=91994 RepID=UPI0021D38F4D|nr:MULTISPECIES: acylphosphatase [unclassified Staphylococcus]UXR68786.1 acylphosphatase [Staphylococcus sp. IVB6246]UXR70843.1 acylphosphatase [Staphylococcus sp. IVB6240]UXR73073.1 acylphosphatase [Staphylococcus sp. IVB6238]UXR75369.1 acylphosphatase [Staphylococcus sp. IVB6233]UXR79572.1 acylphosphatase [Staphylococcus sp. IVB6218]